jgi:hypothetical protein
MNPIFESRQLAQKGLAGDSATFSTPNIAGPLEWLSYLIAIARITAVQFPTGTTPRTTIGFHVERLLSVASGSDQDISTIDNAFALIDVLTHTLCRPVDLSLQSCPWAKHCRRRVIRAVTASLRQGEFPAVISVMPA